MAKAKTQSGKSKEKRYYWLKLPVDFFRQMEIKRLRRIPGGDAYTVIYLKMLLISLDNDGWLYYDGMDDDFASSLALSIDEDVEAVKITIQYLMANNILFQKNVAEYELLTAHEMVGSETESARRKRKERERKALIAASSPTNKLNGSRGQIPENVRKSSRKNPRMSKNVQKCPTEKESESEVDSDLDSDIKTTPTPSPLVMSSSLSNTRASELDDHNNITNNDSETEHAISYAMEYISVFTPKHADELRKICRHMSPRLVMYAVDQMASNGANNYKYLYNTLRDYYHKGFKTAAQAQEWEQKRERAKMVCPNSDPNQMAKYM